MKKIHTILLLSFLIGSLSASSTLLPSGKGVIIRKGETLKYFVFEPKNVSQQKGDIFYLPSLFNNPSESQDLLEQWVEMGFRVISIKHRNLKIEDSLEDLQEVEELTRIRQEVPIFVAGWSKGGLTALRLLQSEIDFGGRTLKGIVVFAPFIGAALGQFSPDLIHDDPRSKPETNVSLSEIYNLLNNGFAVRNKKQKNIPILAFIPGEDMHVDPSVTLDWVNWRYYLGYEIYPYFCPEGYHEVQHETHNEISNTVQYVTSHFLALAQEGRQADFKDLTSEYFSACRLYSYDSRKIKSLKALKTEPLAP